MSASLRQLNIKASELARRAEAGETITITDRGRPIAELGPLRSGFKPAKKEDVLRSAADLPAIDYERLRVELDEIADPSWRDPYER